MSGILVYPCAYMVALSGNFAAYPQACRHKNVETRTDHEKIQGALTCNSRFFCFPMWNPQILASC